MKKDLIIIAALLAAGATKAETPYVPLKTKIF
jgi:uncharacterized protein (DUF849 family)